MLPVLAPKYSIKYLIHTGVLLHYRKGNNVYVQGIISTAGYCKFSAWKREAEVPRVPFSAWILNAISTHAKVGLCCTKKVL